MSSNIRLLVDAHCFDYDSVEGINTYIAGLYREAIALAPDITFIFCAANTERLRSVFGDRQNVEYVALPSHGRLSRILFDWNAIIRRVKADVAHFQYVAPPFKNCRTILTLHDVLFNDFPGFFPKIYRILKNGAFRISATRSDLLCTVSEYSRGRISNHYGIPEQEIILTPNAVDGAPVISPQRLEEFRKQRGFDRYILYVSRIEPRKNQLALLRAWLNLGLWREGCDLVFIGRHTLRVPEMDALLRSLDKEILDRIHFYNYIPPEEIQLWYADASLFVYPSLAEGFGIPPIEAGMAGVPVICSDATAMADFDFFGDRLIDVSDQKLLECKISEALEKRESSGERSEAEAEKIRAAIRKKYSWRRSAEALIAGIRARF